MVQQPSSELQVVVKALGYIRTHGFILLAEVLLIYGYAMQSYYRAVPEYTSSGAILIDHAQDAVYKSYLVNSARQSNSRKQNMSQLLSSQEVMERMRSALVDIYDANNHPDYLKKFFPDGVAIPAGALRANVSLSWDRNSDIFSMNCTATHPDAAHDLCLAYMNTVETYYPEIGQRDAVAKRDFIGKQLSTLSTQIADYEVHLLDLQKKNPEFTTFLLAFDEEAGSSTKQHTELSKTNDLIRTNRATRDLLLKAPSAKRGEHTSLATSIEGTTSKLMDLEYRLQLTEVSNDPDKIERIQSLHSSINATREQLSKMNGAVERSITENPVESSDIRSRVAKLEIDYQVLLATRNNLTQQILKTNELEKRFIKQRLEYKRLKADLDHKRTLIKNLYKMGQETELEVSAGISEIYRLREPSKNATRVSPQLGKYIYGALSVCLFVLAITIVLLMAAFPRIDSEEEVNRLNLPVIGKVPVVRQLARTLEDIPSYAVEYLKIMNYRILRETKETRCPVVLVTSGHAREGKSTVVNSLTLTAHDTTRRALLIDGDLLTTRPNQFFAIAEDKTSGLYGLINSPDCDLSQLIVQTHVPGLAFLPRGQRINPATTGNVQIALSKALVELRKQYDVIFIDTPPLFTSNLAHQWAPLADLVVVVARIFVSKPREVIEAIQTVKLYSRAPIGVALNCVPLSGAYRRASSYYFSKRKSKTTAATA
jgi:Mrp family chromosome partitioning ATPase/capsular polysaccharide biosynthesis protein